MDDSRAVNSPEWQLVLSALRDLVGYDRTVLYTVPLSAAPRRRRPGSIYLHGSPAWQEFLAQRRRLDDGEFTVLLALRSLSEEERLLAVGWGTSYANSFLLVEPRAANCDLTNPNDATHVRLVEAARAALRNGTSADGPAVQRAGATSISNILRSAYGTWTYWTGDRGAWQAHHVPVIVPNENESLADPVLAQLPSRFPQERFDDALTTLYRHERELFSGTVARARIPFRSRLGLPVLHDGRAVDRALRRLVNAGKALVYRFDETGFNPFGIGQPVPPEMSEGEFERLLL